jgi:hypothetical protein
VKAGPSWAGEVAAWRELPDYRLRVWPADGTGKWVVELRAGPSRE